MEDPRAWGGGSPLARISVRGLAEADAEPSFSGTFGRTSRSGAATASAGVNFRRVPKASR
jgi:hypothetical protein